MNVIKYSVLTAGLFVIAWNDLKNRRIPNRMLTVLFVCRSCILFQECIIDMENAVMLLISSMAGLLLGGSLFLCCYCFSKGGMGGGDVKMFAVIGFCLGSQEMFRVLCITVGLAAVYCISGILLRKMTTAQTIPLAPFVFGGVLIQLLFKIRI